MAPIVRPIEGKELDWENTSSVPVVLPLRIIRYSVVKDNDVASWKRSFGEEAVLAPSQYLLRTVSLRCATTDLPYQTRDQWENVGFSRYAPFQDR